MGYRSFGLGVYAVAIRFVTMPLERSAMVMNSSQVNGSGAEQMRQAWRIVFKDGFVTPYRAVSKASVTAWFFQYSVMGFVFQLVDTTLSATMGVDRVPYGKALMSLPEAPAVEPPALDAALRLKGKAVLAPALAGVLESVVANRAEVQRFYGISKLASVEAALNWPALARLCGPAFAANSSRNFVMSTTSFVAIPTLYQRHFPLEHRSESSLFWFGLGVNIFGGNVVAITQQALWGRALDYAAVGGGRRVSYPAVVREGLTAEGAGAFFTVPKWSARVLMNAPIQGTMPWFYNQVLPRGEPAVLGLASRMLGYQK